MRYKTEERIMFDREEKPRILAKSNNRCAHCGKPLSKETMTIDHAIPLYKGGSNAFENLVPLCDDCNQSKGNLVINPKQYFKYLNEDEKKELGIMFNAYCEDVSWLSQKTLTREDRVAFNYWVPVTNMVGHASKKNFKGSAKYIASIAMKAILEKAEVTDLQKIKDYTRKYHSKFGLDTDYVDTAVSNIYQNGNIYMITKQGEIVCLLPITISRINLNGTTYYMPTYGGILCLHQRPEYKELIINCIAYINQGIALTNAKNSMICNMNVPKSDPFAADIMYCLEDYGPSYTKQTENEDEDDGWYDKVLFQRYRMFEEDDDEHGYTSTKEELEEELLFFSNHCRRIFKLPYPEDKNERIKNIHDKKMEEKSRQKRGNKLQKKEQRRLDRDHIDEYDIRYYNV